MPKLDWIGKEAVVQHHNEVPYRLLHCDKKLSVGDPDSGNLLVEGDNLEALKSLLPYYAGKINCIYIDPPYNTGNEGWAYNDKVNSPEIKRWLSKVVGGENEDLCRHDKWLCMMYPRLRLLRDFLRDDGVIFVSIDENEQHHLHLLMNEIFGSNKTETIIWRKSDDGRYGKMKQTKTVRNDHEYIMAGYKDGAVFSKIMALPFFSSRPREDKDGRKWWSGYIARGERGGNPNHENFYTVTSPNGKKRSAQFEVNYEEFIRLDMAGYIHWSNSGIPYRKIYTHEERPIVGSSVFLDVGTSYQGRIDYERIFGGDGVFSNPKPVKLIQRLLELATANSPDALILDSFAGSGTTAQAVLQQNKKDKGNRRFILVEMDKEISKKTTAKRIQAVIKGYKNQNIQGANDDKSFPPLGGGFRYCSLGEPLFNEFGGIMPNVKFNDLAGHIFFSETGSPIPQKPKNVFLGMFEGQAIYLLFNGIMGDKSKNGGNILTVDMLNNLPPHTGEKKAARIIYGEGCLLSDSRLKRENILFRQIPYQIKRK